MPATNIKRNRKRKCAALAHLGNCSCVALPSAIHGGRCACGIRTSLCITQIKEEYLVFIGVHLRSFAFSCSFVPGRGHGLLHDLFLSKCHSPLSLQLLPDPIPLICTCSGIEHHL
jgi:hypothetical protein